MWFSNWKKKKKYDVTYAYKMERVSKGGTTVQKIKQQHFKTDYPQSKARDDQARARVAYMKWSGGWYIVEMECTREDLN